MREMKDSGVEWIGEIPNGWEISRVSYFFDIQLGKMLQPTQEKEDETLEEYLCSINVNNNEITQSDLKTMWFSPNEKLTFNINRGDLIVVEGGDVAASAIVKTPVENLYFQNALHRVRGSGDVDVRYLHYLLITAKASGHIDLLCNKATISHFSKEKFKALEFVVNSSEVQHRIADYLDAKCTQIDRAIARQQEVIEKLKAYKLSVITEAVTKGLNPDVPMKDSGIEWIGEIPEHWEVSALKNYIDVLPGYAFSSLDFDTENGIPLLRGVNVTPNGLRWDDVVYWNKSISDELEPFALCKNDIVFGLDRPWINEGTRITIISENDLPCLLLQRVCRIRGAGDLDFRIVYYWLGSSMFQDIVSLATTGVSVPHISTRQIGNFFIAVPPEAEQKHICEYLDSRCSKINAIVIQKNEIISKLTEYKKSLIYEVVTGKREV